MRAAALALALTPLAASASLAFDRHCFSIWSYPWPQHCVAGHGAARDGRAGHGAADQGKGGDWYVEIVTPPPKDERTPQDIADQAEHDAAVHKFHDQINLKMMILREKEAEGIDPNDE